LQILAPTLLEYLAVRRRLPNAGACWAGVKLSRWSGATDGSLVVVCGLAGALAPGVRPGTVLIPEQVGLPDGTALRCDRQAWTALVTAARAAGFVPHTGPLLTAPSMVVGPARQTWAQRGFVAADMETGLLAGRALRVATIRVALDGEGHDISSAWERPSTILVRPRLWRELFWLSLAAPRCSLRAAKVLQAGLDALSDTVHG
jgi:hypothetical protein